MNVITEAIPIGNLVSLKNPNWYTWFTSNISSSSIIVQISLPQYITCKKIHKLWTPLWLASSHRYNIINGNCVSSLGVCLRLVTAHLLFISHRESKWVFMFTSCLPVVNLESECWWKNRSTKIKIQCRKKKWWCWKWNSNCT